jgi:hypothetical protein
VIKKRENIIILYVLLYTVRRGAPLLIVVVWGMAPSCLVGSCKYLKESINEILKCLKNARLHFAHEFCRCKLTETFCVTDKKGMAS